MLKPSLTWWTKNPSLLVDVADNTGVNVDGGDHEDRIVKRLLRSKNLNGAGYLTPKARLTFTQLKKAFTNTSILQHFDLEYHWRIVTNASGYAIGRVLSYLTLDNLDRWHPVAYFLQKIIPTKTRYETHNGKLLAIVEALKTWCHNLKGCKYKVLVLFDHNNPQQFIDLKNLSSC